MSLPEDDLDERLARLRDATDAVRPRAAFADAVARGIESGRAAATPLRAPSRLPRYAGWAALAASVLLVAWYVSERPPSDRIARDPDPGASAPAASASNATPAPPTSEGPIQEADASARSERARDGKSRRPDAGGPPRVEPSGSARSGDDAGTAIARQHFQRGLQLYEEQDFAGAITELGRAYDAAPNYRIHYNVSQAHKAAGDDKAAARALERYLREGGGDIPVGRRLEAERELAQLRDAGGT